MSSAHGGSLPDFDARWNYNNPAETEVVFRKILTETEATANPSYLAELRTQIARTLGLQQKFTEAHALLDTVEAGLEKTSDTVRVRYLLERGRAYNSSQMQDKALPLFKDAFEVGLKAGLDNYAVDAAHMVAIADTGVERSKWNEQAIALAAKSQDPKARKWLGSLYNNKGWDLFDRKQYDSALDVFQKAYDARKESGEFRPMQIARWCIAKTMRMLGRVDEALKIQQDLEKAYARSGEGDNGYVFEELGECLLTLGRKDEAAPYFAKAYEILIKDAWLQRDQPERLERLKQLGNVK